jgi:hypothetical protein
MSRHVFTGAALAVVALVAGSGGPGFERTAAAQDQKPGAGAVLPIFEVDSQFPTMPDHMLLGGVGGATADSHGNVWVFHRPHTLEEGNATENGYKPAPPVLQFSPSGRYILGWGGPAKGQYEWFNRGGLHSAHVECQSCTTQRRLNGDGRPGSGEHGIFVDANDNVWLTGNGDGDGQILKFTKDGKFLLQIGKGGVGPDSNNTEHLSRPAAVTVHANEVLVADGYGNRRVIVFDAATGAYKRHWGAYGKAPTDNKITYDPKAAPQPQFNNPVHCIRMSKDGLVYVCDRGNNRIQVFRKDGTYVTEFAVLKDTMPAATTGSVMLWPDAQQTYMLVSDDPNGEFHLLNRADGKYLASFGRVGHNAGEFDNLHNLAIDSKGNIYAAEVQGKRVQKFRNLGGL